MGILNVTPDSFSDGGRFSSSDAAAEAGLAMFDQGAAIVDVGGESTRPSGEDYGSGYSDVDAAEELARVIPVIERLARERPDRLVSIDTVKPSVAAAALDSGAAIVNDVSGGSHDPTIQDVVAERNAIYVTMHGHDRTDRRTVEEVEYADVTEFVYRDLFNKVVAARDRGIGSIVIDPGIGFAKGAGDSARLIRELWRISPLGLPILVGASRKSFIGRALGGRPVDDRTCGSIGAAAAASMNGASILRVHDVRETCDFFRLYGLLRDGRL